VAKLGNRTLLTYVPPALGASHQAGALVLFTLVLAMAHSVRPAAPTRAAQLVAKLLPAATVAATVGIATAVTQTY
jgi:heme A synthase